jgi:hypothetical protein
MACIDFGTWTRPRIAVCLPSLKAVEFAYSLLAMDAGFELTLVRLVELVVGRCSEPP